MVGPTGLYLMKQSIGEIAAAAKQTSIVTASLSTEVKNCALGIISQRLGEQEQAITEANRADLERAEGEGVSEALRKRLRFDSAKLAEAIAGVDSLIGLADPVGRTLSYMKLAKGLELYQKIKVPILAIIGDVHEFTVIPIKEAAQLLRDENTNAEAHIIKGAPHNFKGKEKEFIEIVIDFVNRRAK